MLKKMLAVSLCLSMVVMLACNKSKIDSAFNLASVLAPNALRLAMLSGVTQVTEETIASVSDALKQGKDAYDAWDEATGPDKSNKWKDVQAAVTIIQTKVVDIFEAIHVDNPNVQTAVQLGLTVVSTVLGYVIAQAPDATDSQKKAVRPLDVNKTKADFNAAVTAAKHPELAVQ